MPGTLVGFVPNSPRYSAGAAGLGSHMSMCDGPPRIHRMITDGRRPPFAGAGAAVASWRSRAARPRPAALAWRKPRRLSDRERRKSGQPGTMAGLRGKEADGGMVSVYYGRGGRLQGVSWPWHTTVPVRAEHS